MKAALGAKARAVHRGFFARIKTVKLTAEDETRIDALLADLRLTHLAARHPQSLSGGEKQRLVIACALVKDPAILILDEPTSGLDGANMASIAGLLEREAKKGRAVFLITHDLELLDACERALDMTAVREASRRSVAAIDAAMAGAAAAGRADFRG